MSLLAFWLSLSTIVKNEKKRKTNKQNPTTTNQKAFTELFELKCCIFPYENPTHTISGGCLLHLNKL